MAVTPPEWIAELASTNESALDHYDSFASHRAKLSALCIAASPSSSARLCVLGAGNCFDLELTEIAGVYSEVHLVDLDAAALHRAYERQPPVTKSKLFLHAPVELSGLADRLADWRAHRVTPEEMMAMPDRASRTIAAALPGPFDVVVSACLLTQLQLSIVTTLGTQHRLLEATRQIENLVHLRTLTKLLAASGKALLVSDLTSNLTYPFETTRESDDFLSLAHELVRTGNVIYAANPELMAWCAKEDPFLKHYADLSPMTDAWLWRNGPSRIFLVYSMTLTRRAHAR